MEGFCTLTDEGAEVSFRMIDGQFKKKLDELLAVCRTNLRTVDEDLISRAFEMSLAAHKHDLRALGELYLGLV